MVKHSPCEVCEYSIDGVECGQNIEKECREGGGYESFKPHALAMKDRENLERYVAHLEQSNAGLIDTVMARNKELSRLEEQLRRVKPKKLDRAVQWSAVSLAWACWGLLIWRLIEYLRWRC